MSMEYIMITSYRKAHKWREKSTRDVLGEYLHMESDENIIMTFKVWLSNLLSNIKPTLNYQYVIIEQGVKMFCVRSQNYLYRLLCIVLLSDLKLVTELKNIGFSQNPYAPCVAKNWLMWRR